MMTWKSDRGAGGGRNYSCSPAKMFDSWASSVVVEIMCDFKTPLTYHNYWTIGFLSRRLDDLWKSFYSFSLLETSICFKGSDYKIRAVAELVAVLRGAQASYKLDSIYLSRFHPATRSKLAEQLTLGHVTGKEVMNNLLDSDLHVSRFSSIPSRYASTHSSKQTTFQWSVEARHLIRLVWRRASACLCINWWTWCGMKSHMQLNVQTYRFLFLWKFLEAPPATTALNQT